MNTSEALTRFLKKCEELGKSPSTRRQYYGYLRHFAGEFPELPLETSAIEKFLKARKETPAHRGYHFKSLQAFYTYLEKFEGVKSPVPPKGKMGRPPKVKLVSQAEDNQLDPVISLEEEKLVRGGGSASTCTSISTAEAAELFLKSRVAQGCTKKTLANYRSNLGKFARECPVLPLEIEPVEEFLADLKSRDGRPLDQETKWDYRKDLKALYHFLAERKKIPKDCCPVPKIKLPRKVRRVLSREELTSLFYHAEDFQERVILALLTDTKVRSGELCSITRDKVFPKYITVSGKTGQRNVSIKPEMYELLTRLQPEGFLFRTNGRQMYVEKVYKIVHRIMLAAGLRGKKLGPHIIRHSASVLQYTYTKDLLALKEELGHTTTRMTERYAQLSYSEVEQTHHQADVLGHVMPGQAKAAAPPPPDHTAPNGELVSAFCINCGLRIRVPPEKIKTTECIRCHQVGHWELVEDRVGKVAEVKHG